MSGLGAVHPTALFPATSACAEGKGPQLPPILPQEPTPAGQKELPVPGQAPLWHAMPTAPAHLLLPHWCLGWWDGGRDGAAGAAASSTYAAGRRSWPLPPAVQWALAGHRCGMLPGVCPAAARSPCPLSSPAWAPAGFQHSPTRQSSASPKPLACSTCVGSTVCACWAGFADPAQAPAAQLAEELSSSLSQANTASKT